MLRVVYEASEALEPHQLVTVTETRGMVSIKLRAGTMASQYLDPLNAALAQFVGECGWFQIWRGQIISADSPDSPLTVRYVSDPDVDLITCVQIREHRGLVRLHVCPDATSEQLVRALNPAVERFLAGGQWFQLWQGEIVTMDSSETLTV